MLAANESTSTYNPVDQSTSGGNGGGGSGGGSPAQTSIPTMSPIYDDLRTSNVPTLAESYSSFFGQLSTGTLGGLLPSEDNYMNGSEQPLAPQAPGNVLYGRFGNAMTSRKVWVVGALLLAVVVWYFWRKRSSA